ncbi:hypothetical protein GGR57DRAFT_518873 [Xylariaceae sp. FL1272]|nr:hypothetical protein GGR57DRAFT_518873 [Xylariaceae sp. FL1272]
MVLYEDHAPHLAAAVITIGIFGYITYGLRVFCRLRLAAWGIEDWCMTVAIPPFTVLTAACIACAFNGIGALNKTLALPGNEIYEEKGLFFFFLFEVFYCVTIIPVKLSIALMLIRIARNRKAYVYVIWVTIGLFTTMNLIAALYIIFQCNPVAAAWDTSLLEKGGKCNDSAILADIYYATTAVNILTDWTTAFMPIPLLWNVNLNRNSKVSVAFVLGLGFFASLSACVRLKYTVALTFSEDYLFAVSDIALWGYAENGLGVVVGCIATLKPLFRKVFGLSEGSTDPTAGKTPIGQRNNYGFPSNARRTYAECEDGYELNSPCDEFDKHGGMHSTRVTKDDDGSLSDTASHKKILQNDRGNHIVVSHQIQITHERDERFP